MKIPVAISALAAIAFVKADTEKPNLLLTCVDDLKPLLGCNGDEAANNAVHRQPRGA